MTLQEIADALAHHCRNGTEEEGLKTLYAEDAVSVEAMAQPGGGPQVFEGLDALRGKHDYWNNTMEIKSMEVLGPYPHQPDKFALVFKGEAVVKESGESFPMDEVAIFTVKNGKIVREEFFYSM
ncbi:nuclear transport factor 2 family protein [Ahrensia marina]|uniref:SnoaL-like domain-containing protein n=1 Tax=Ahrensia marina TaxID=1514904 RepID=UPI0035CEF4AE